VPAILLSALWKGKSVHLAASVEALGLKEGSLEEAVLDVRGVAFIVIGVLIQTVASPLDIIQIFFA
jgi:hypothetical protein